MPLHLSQHKSYHPYRQDNRERVSRDEARAAQKEEQRRQASFAHRDQARLEALRSGRKHVWSTQGTTEDSQSASASNQTHRTRLDSKPQSGHSLLRPEAELTPWYTTSQLRNGAEARKTDDQRLEDAYKDSAIKSSNDPLKAMQAYLAQRKAAKDLPARSPSPSGLDSDNTYDLYEPDAVRAAKHRRRQHSDRRSSPSRSSHHSRSKTHRNHRTTNDDSRR